MDRYPKDGATEGRDWGEREFHGWERGSQRERGEIVDGVAKRQMEERVKRGRGIELEV